ncbi:MAG: hypothetical protein CVV32_06290 [Methanomicrobiales archaeon HGW-Methanomicrobiales-3]|nr:MAG: hypothetical protein CVV32_06290 [Methanomicrobiales archaeon HGW-Methanomicrobiales-3]
MNIFRLQRKSRRFVLIIICCLCLTVVISAAGAPVISSVTPSEAGNEMNLTLTLHGSGFEPRAKIVLTPVTLKPELLCTMDENSDEKLLVQPMDLVAIKNYLYLFDLGNTFTIVNVSDPRNPVRTGTIPLRTKGIVAAIQGHYAYVTGGAALDILDISDPANPIHAGYVSNGNSGTILREGFGIGVADNHVYIPSVLTDSLEVFDVTDRERPVFRARITNRDFGSKINNPNNIFVSGNYAYLTSAASNAFEIIDISNPRMPDHKGYLANGEGGALLTIPNSVYVKGRYAYVTSSGDNALEIIDVSDTEKPVHAGSLTNGETGAWLSGPYGVKVAGNYLFVGTDNTLEIIDITDPVRPRHKHSMYEDTSPYVHGPRNAFDIEGRYAYVTRNKVSDGYTMPYEDPKNMLDIFDIGFIPATDVTIHSQEEASCTIELPQKSVPGLYNVVITNPDGQFGVLESGFKIPEPVGSQPEPEMPIENPPETTPTARILPFSAVVGILIIAIIFRKQRKE